MYDSDGMRETMLSFTSEALMPAVELCQIQRGGNSMIIGVPKEKGEFEKRLPLTPEAVALLCGEGHRIILERGAGDAIFYSDLSYSEAGAEITDNKAAVWQADIVLKVAPPLPEEIAWMKPRSTLISMLQLSLFKIEAFQLMLERKITAVAYELIADKHGENPIMNSILEIEGRTAIIVAADLLTNLKNGKGVLLGSCAGVSPTEVVIIGAGRAGLEAARTASALGALVKIFDNDIDLLREVQHVLGQSTFTSTLHPAVLKNALRSADVIIGVLRFENGEKRFAVSEDMVKLMKRGAIVLDLSVDNGGCFETSICPGSIGDALFEEYGVLHYCEPNISSRVARTTSFALSNHFVPLLFDIAEFGSIVDFIRNRDSVRNGVYLYAGKPVNGVVGDHFGMQWSDLMLFLTSFQ